MLARRCPLIRAERGRSSAPAGKIRVARRFRSPAIAARATGIVDQVDAAQHVLRATDDVEAGKCWRRHLHLDEVSIHPAHTPTKTPASTSARLVKKGDLVRAGDVVADGPSTDPSSSSARANCSCSFIPWNWSNFEIRS